MKGARLNRKMRSSNLQQNKTKTGRSRISLKLPQRFISRQKPLTKGKGWSKTILLWDSQPRKRMVLGQRQKQQPNAVVQGKEIGETNETADDNPKKETLTVIPPTPMENQRPNTGKSLLTWECERRGWCQKEEELVKIQVRLQKELVDMGTLFAQKFFQLYSNFNDIVNYTLSSGFSGSGLIPIGGMSLFPI